MNKKQLAVILSRLKTFQKQKVELEQYQTESELAAQLLWFAYLNKDIEDKVIADLGCGTGIFGFGALLLGAKKVYFVDIDKSVLEIAKQNKEFLEKEYKLNAVFFNKDIKTFRKKVDLVIQNPPFGVKVTHIDKLFLVQAMKSAQVIYTIHKIESKKFIEKLAQENNFKVESILEFDFPLKRTLWFHKKKTHYVKVGCWKLIKK